MEELRNYVRLVLTEGRDRGTVTISNGTEVPFGSLAHIKDLQARIADLARWRDKQRRGSEARANYSRLVQRLKAELNSAKKYAARIRDERGW